jgi:hypothetical protein
MAMAPIHTSAQSAAKHRKRDWAGENSREASHEQRHNGTVLPY